MKETVATLAQSECSKVIPMKESRRIEKQAGERDEKFLLAGWYHLYIIEGHTDTGGLYDLVEAWFPSGAQVSPHVHRRYDEQIYVLDGEFTVWTGKRAYKTALRPGNDIIIPAGTPTPYM